MHAHPLLYLLASEPQALARHAQAYGDLVVDEAAGLVRQWRRRACLQVAAVACGAVCLGVAAVALMLWGVTPVALQPAPGLWALAIALPGVPALTCAVLARRAAVPGPFADTRAQWRADLQVLREARAA